jgi:hypothetical protein
MAKNKEDNTMAKNKEDNTMAKNKEDNAMAKNKEDNTMAKNKEDNTMAKNKEDNAMAMAMVLSDVLRCVLYNIVSPFWFWPWYCLTFFDVLCITLFVLVGFGHGIV